MREIKGLSGNSLVVQWLGLHASLLGAWIQSLVEPSNCIVWLKLYFNNNK